MAFLPRSRLFLEKTLTSLQAGEALSSTKPHELFPAKIGDKWHKPLLSAKAVSVLRKEVVLNGYSWPWDQAKQPSKLFDIDRKGRANRLARVAKIEAGVKIAQDRLVEYFKQRQAKYKAVGTMAKFFQQVDKPVDALGRKLK